LEGVEAFLLVQGVADHFEADAVVSFQAPAVVWGSAAVAERAGGSFQLLQFVGGQRVAALALLFEGSWVELEQDGAAIGAVDGLGPQGDAGV
jgi:hypothetical protein